MRNDFDAAIAEVGDVDSVAEVAGAALDLDALLQEGGEGRGVEDAVVGRLGGIDDVLQKRSVSLLKSIGRRTARHTFFVTFWFFFTPAPLIPLPPAVGLFCNSKHLSTCSQAYCANALAHHETEDHSRPRSHGGVRGQQSEIRTVPATIVMCGMNGRRKEVDILRLVNCR